MRTCAGCFPARGLLASRRSGIVELWLLDVWTRLWMPEHPLRHKLNAVIAVHECDAVGYAELSRSVLPTWVWLSLVATRYVIALGLTFIWVGGLYCCYRVRTWLPG